MGEGSSWHRVVLEVASVEAELAADALWAAGTAGIEEQALDGGSTTRLLAGFEGRAGAERAISLLGPLGLADARIEAVTDDGLDAWRPFATVERAGPFVVVPAWLEAPDVADGEHVLRIDPARTFGSGSHPTTRLVLQALADRVRPGQQVLDVGCGSGVLAVAAAVLGADAVGIDIDAGSPAATQANAAANGVAGRVWTSASGIEAVLPRRFDLVLANLLAPVIADLGPQLVAATAPGGLLVASGLLADRWEASLVHLVPLVPVEVLEDDGWVAVVLAQGR